MSKKIKKIVRIKTLEKEKSKKLLLSKSKK